MNSQPELRITGDALITNATVKGFNIKFPPQPEPSITIDYPEGHTVFIQVRQGGFDEYVIKDGKLALVKEAGDSEV